MIELAEESRKIDGLDTGRRPMTGIWASSALTLQHIIH